ncbi:MAG: hypothetical protein HKO68_01075 [Desulfobacterales bacterium]|nr:hypothetical protein [Desulfobacterales bacterium]
MKQDRKKHHKSSIRMIEETAHVLRSAPVTLLAGYYLGSVPFMLGLLYFWADMSRSAHANEHCAMAAAGLAFLFVWMKFWQTVFVLQVRAQIFGEMKCRWSLRRITSIVATQALIQSTRIIAMPIAGLMVIPYGFCYAFYQNATAHVAKDVQNLKSTSKWAWSQAKLWPRQNHLLIGIFSMFGLVIFVNVSITAFMMPQLLKTLFGIESVFTVSGIRMLLNTTFWIAMLAMTYLLLDPFIKTAYVLRCFYGSALESGEDLKTDLHRILISAKNVAAGLLIALLCAAPLVSAADQGVSISPQELDTLIEETMARPEFSWRMPREAVNKEEKEAKGPLGAAVEWLLDMIGEVIRTIGKWVTNFFKWIENLLPERDRQPGTSSGNWMTPVRVVLILLLLLLLVVLTLVFIRIWRRFRSRSYEKISTVAVPAPDLNDEGIKADDLPANRWLALSKELTAKGELRLAMRALYLATLAHLAQHEMITIETYKSNREYEKELKRRAHGRKELLLIFENNLTIFERVWYGMYRIAQSDFEQYAANQKRILAFANQ